MNMHIHFYNPIIFGLAIFISLNFAFAEEDNISQNGLTMLKRKGASVWVSTEYAPLYTSPDTERFPILFEKWMQQLPVDQLRLSNAPSGWIPIEGTGDSPAGSNLPPAPDAWIRGRDVVIGDRFRKVIACWPVKSMTYEIGDYAAEITFSPNGKAHVREQFDSQNLGFPKHEKAQVYIDRNIIKIKSTRGSYGFDYFLIAGYRPAERRLYPNGNDARQELFSETVLRGCNAIPTVK